MKKLVCLLLTLLLCACAAAAENTPAPEGFEAQTETLTQDYYVTLQLIFEQPADQTREIVLQVKPFTVQYTFEVYRNAEDGAYRGFRYDPETFISLIKVAPEDTSPFLNLMNLTASVKEAPTNVSFSGSPDSYFLHLNGGSMELSYIGIMRFNLFGELVEAVPVSVDRSFYYSNTPFVSLPQE